MRAVIAATVAAAGCGASAPTCILEDVLTDRVGAQELEDCGTVAVTAPLATLQLTHDCIVDAQAALRPFRAVLEAAGADQDFAYLGITEGGAWKTYWLMSSGIDVGTRTLTSLCGSFAESSPCDDVMLRGSLCVDCVPRTPIGACPVE